jgi:hypothetical protein
MTSQIDITKPVFGNPTTQSVRDNFTTAANEITTLQQQTSGSPFLPLLGGRMTGAMYLFNDPTDAMMPATKGYVDAHTGSGGGGIPEAPSDAFTYGRFSGAWRSVLPLIGGTLTGALILAADPTNVLGAVTKQYADAIAASHLVDAPNDVNTYGRRANAWVGVLPIIGGQLNGSLGVGLPLPATLSTTDRAVIAGQISVRYGSALFINAYNDSTPTTHYRVAGPAFAVGTNGGNLAFYVAPSGAADAAITWPNPLQFDAKGNLIMPGANTIPTDNNAPWISCNEFVTEGHYAFNCYIATPSQWKFLGPGYAAQWWQNISQDGNVNLNISQSSGAAGGAIGTMSGFAFTPMGHFFMSGRIQAGPAVIASASPGNAFVGCWQTAGTTPSNVGMWNYNNTLYWGNADGNGVPSAARAHIDPGGYLQVNGAFLAGGDIRSTAGNFFSFSGIFLNNAQNFGIYPQAGACIYQWSSGWYWSWDTGTGNMSYVTPGGGQINTRLSPDNLMWNNIGPVGGYGAYIVLSDERAKGEVSLATVGLKEVLQLVPINFTRIVHEPPQDATMEDGSPVSRGVHPPEIGFSAQQVQPIIPEAVRRIGWTLPDGSGGFDTDEPSLGLTETAILAAAINAIKEIEARLVAKGI